MQRAIAPIVGLARPGVIPRADLVIAAGLFVWALLEALLLAGAGSSAERVALASAFSLPLALRRRFPLAVIAVVALAALVRGALDGPWEEGAMPLPALLLASFSAALYAQPRRASWLTLPVPAAAWMLSGVEPPPNAGNYAALALMTAGAWTAGRLIRRRAEQLERARARSPHIAAEAVAGERARIRASCATSSRTPSRSSPCRRAPPRSCWAARPRVPARTSRRCAAPRARR